MPEVYTEEPPQTGPRRVTVKRPGELGIVMIAQKIPPATHGDYAALQVLSMILSDGRNSRLYQALTDKSLTIDVDTEPEFNRDPSLFLVTAQLTPNATHADVEQRLLREISRVQRAGVQPDEVAAAIAKLTANSAYARDGSMAMAFALNDYIAVGDWSLYYRLDEAVKHVTSVDVQRVAELYFNEDQRVTGWYVPSGEKTGEAKDSIDKTAVFSDSAEGKPKTSATGAPPASTQSTAPPLSNQLSADAPTAAEIAPRILRTRTHGIDLLICPTGVKDVVTITGALPAFDPTNPILGELASEMLERGTAKHDAQAIATLLDMVGAQIHFSVDAGSIHFVARCLKKDSGQVIKLLAEQLREPSFPSDEFEKLQKQKLAEAQQMKQATDIQAVIAFRRAIFTTGNPQYRLTSEERIAALKAAKVAQVKAFHDKWFGPDHSTMVVVGDVDPTLIQAQVAAAFNGWTGGQPLPAIPAPIEIKKPVELTVVVPGKKSVSVILGAPSGLRYADADYLPLAVATDVLGHGFTSRLTGAVRDTEGLTYGIEAGLTGSGQLDQAWVVNATFAPLLVKQGLASVRRELAAWHQKGISAAELEYRKSALAGAHRVSLATSAGLADTILETIRRGLELSWIDEYPKKLAALNLEQINRILRHHLDPEKLVTVRAGTIDDP
jgi:zinc protease